MSQTLGTPTVDQKEKLKNALILNRQMQLQLVMAKDKIEKLLQNVKDSYSNNEIIMRNQINMRKKGFGMRGAYLRGGTFYLKGNMFFKDVDCRNCPDNPDYTERKRNNEMFPKDYDLRSRHVWSLNDKKGVVEGIKDQVIQHLKDSGQETENDAKELNSEKLVKLLQIVKSDFHIDWQQISQYNLLHRHSAISCEAMWNVYLHPTLKRCKWTDKENLKLLEVVQKHKGQNWLAIAKDVGARSDFQCFVQYQIYVRYMETDKYKKWNNDDDARLIEVIEKNSINGIVNWSNVMLHFPQKPRTTLQCRYMYSLCPDINRAPFTPEEDLLLLASVKEYGTNFSSFPRKLFPNRTTVQLRTRYRNTLVHRHKPKTWTLDDDNKLVEFVSQHGTSSWKKCEEFVETHSRISCRTRYFIIEKYLKQNPDAQLADIPRKRQKVYSFVNTQNWTEKLVELTKNPNAQLVKIIPQKRAKPKKAKELKPKPEKQKKERKKRIPKKKNLEIKRKIDRRKKIYLHRLRVHSIPLYHSFKYAYNAESNKDRFASFRSKCFSNLPIFKEVLKLPKISPNMKGYYFDNNVSQSTRAKIKKNLKRDVTYNLPEEFSLPPSWSTCIGFRALCIHSSHTERHIQVNSPKIDDSNIHLQMFRYRLRSLFYSTALLSRLPPSMVGWGESSNKKRKPNDEILLPPVKKRKISVIDQILNIKREKSEL